MQGEKGAAASAQGAAAVQQLVFVGHLKAGGKAKLGDIQLSLNSPLVEGFHVFQLCVEPEAGGIDGAVHQGVKNKCIVRAGRKSKAQVHLLFF